MNLKNITLIALVASCFLQVGAQLFAVSVVASTVSAAPPRSFAILEGEYAFNSNAFWDIVPSITYLLFIIALVTNWNTHRRKPILFALILFAIAGLVAGILLEPLFADLIKTGFIDKVDAILQKQAKRWYLFDWMVWVLAFIAALTLLLALTRHVTTLRKHQTADSY